MTGIVVPNNGTIGSASDTDAISISSSGAVTLSSDFVPATPLSHRNMIINGAMQVAQRGTSFTSVTSSAYHLDRFHTILASVGTYTITQETASPPDGFTSSYKIACTAANSSNDAGDAGVLYYTFEGQDVYHLKYNSSGAVTTTLSFWVKAKETGNYQVNLVGNNRHIGATYTISVADTWEYKTITFAGDTSGNWMSSNNTAGGRIEWWFEGGSNYVGGAVPTSWEAVSATDRNAGQTAQKLGNDTANYWQISGIQWEKGSVATPFEHRRYAEELQNCLRYYHAPVGGGIRAVGTSSSTSSFTFSYSIGTRMRDTPTLVHINSAAHRAYHSEGTGTGGFSSSTTNFTISNMKGDIVQINAPGHSGLTDNRPYTLGMTGSYEIALSSELS